MSVTRQRSAPHKSPSLHVPSPRPVLLAFKLITLRRVLDIRLRAVHAGGGFGAPFAVRGLVFDHLGASRCALFPGGAPGGSERCGMGDEALRKYAVDGIGPAAIVLDDLVGEMAHSDTRCFR